MAAVGIWLLIEVSRSRSIIRRPTLPVIMLIVFVLYTLILEMMTHGAGGLASRIQLYIMFFFLVVQQAYRNDFPRLRTIFWFVIVAAAVAMTTTYLYLSFVDARAMRTLVRSTEAAQDLTEQGVGGYSLAYGAILMLPGLTVLSLRPSLIDRLAPNAFFRSFSLLPKLLIWYLTGLSILLVISSQFATAVMILMVCMTIVLVLWRLTVLRIVIALVLVFVIVFFLDALLIKLFVFLAPLVEGSNYALKITDLLGSLRGDAAAGTVNDRLDRYMRSLFLFFENPVTGTLFFTDVGKHSTILDTFARWGFVFGAIFVYLISFQQIRALRPLLFVRGGLGVALGSSVSIIMVFGLNNVFMSAGIIIYIFYPLVFFVMTQPQLKERKADPAVQYA